MKDHYLVEIGLIFVIQILCVGKQTGLTFVC